MRLRNIPGAREEMLVNPYVVQKPAAMRGKWSEFFGNSNPLRIEVGMGKGRFIMDLARQNPDVNYIGIEKYSSVLLRALEKRELEPDRKNLFFLRIDAEQIPEIFAEGEVDRIYLNFSDPWPKDRHAKRRLTSPQFLARYEKILKHGEKIEFKTDNQDLFTFSLESAAGAPAWELLYETRDLHHSEHMEGNVMTEYEERFSSQGNPICKMELKLK